MGMRPVRRPLRWTRPPILVDQRKDPIQIVDLSRYQDFEIVG
jgi:hypothetical protein